MENVFWGRLGLPKRVLKVPPKNLAPIRTRYEKYLPPLQQSWWTESDTFSYDPERFDLACEAEWPDELDLYRVMAKAEPAGRPGRTGAGAGAGAKSRKK